MGHHTMRKFRFPEWKPSIVPRPGFILYLFLAAAALVFTQVLRSPASALFFWFMLLLPAVSVLYLLIARAVLQVYAEAEKETVEKMQPLVYEIKVINAFAFPFAHVEAVLSLPEKTGVRCAETRMELSLVPFGAHTIRETVCFPYRGTYEIGIHALIVSDFLHLFRLRVDAEILHTVLVLPRHLLLSHNSITSATDVPTDSSRTLPGKERSEISEIRGYIRGDSLKDIHWKLSSKTEELQVKQYAPNAARTVYILCDYSRRAEEKPAKQKAEPNSSVKKRKKAIRVRAQAASRLNRKIAEWREAREARLMRRRRQNGMSRGKAEDIAGLDELIRKTAQPGIFRQILESAQASEPENSVPEAEVPEIENNVITEGNLLPQYEADADEFCADGVAEIAIAALEQELRRGHTCTLLWFDAREESGIGQAELSSEENFASVYTKFATAPCCSSEDEVTKLALLIRETQNITLRIVTPHADTASLERFSAVPAMFGGAGTGCAAEVLLFNPEDRYGDIRMRREYIDVCRGRLAQDGILLTEFTSLDDQTLCPR